MNDAAAATYRLNDVQRAADFGFRVAKSYLEDLGTWLLRSEPSTDHEQDRP